MAQPIVNDEMVEEDVFGGCPNKGQPPCHKWASPMASPSQQASSDPFKLSSLHLPDQFATPQGGDISCAFSPFVRTYSGSSTVVPDSAPMTPLVNYQPDPMGLHIFDPTASFAFSRCSSGGWDDFNEKMAFLPSQGQIPDLPREAQVENLEVLLEDVKAMYNSRYSDCVDEVETEEVQNILEEVKELYNSKYPLDQVDDLDTELEYDEDGALWVKTVREQDVPIQTQQLKCLELKLEEVKNLYNDKYPDDHVENASCDVERDADGAQWVTHAGESVLDMLDAQLKEVKKAYIERYACDNTAGEAGCHCDGPCESEVEEVFDLLDEVKGLYNMKYWPDTVDEVAQVDEVFDLLDEVKGLYNMKYGPNKLDEVAQVENLEALLEDVKAMYNSRYSDSVDEFDTDVVQNLLEEVKELYNSKCPLDQVDDLDTELEYDEDGALWVKTVREQDVPIQTQQLKCLELKLEEVKNLYNDKYPDDHVENASCDVERDADGAQWVTHAGESVLDMLDAQLKEVKKAYIERYACDNTAGE